jgi:hypothetical protein
METIEKLIYEETGITREDGDYAKLAVLECKILMKKYAELESNRLEKLVMQL